MPWQGTGLKHDDYWRLPEAERKARQEKLRSLPTQWTRQPADGGERSYEAQQAPLYYWLLAPAYRLTSGLALPTRVWLLRLVSLLIASAVVPLGFLVAREISREDRYALGVAALIAALPELMMTVCHIANDSLAVAVGSLFLLLLFRWKQQPHSMGRAIAVGTTLGLALLTKAYFLALVPPLLILAVIVAIRRRAYGQVTTIFAAAILISAWWYARNWSLTHSISGNQFEVAARGAPQLSLLGSTLRVNWLRAADFTFLSHIWLGNWSFLVVRSWMYHFFAFIAALSAIGLLLRLFRRPNSDLFLLCGIYLSFVVALAYHALRAFQIEGFAGALGFYLFPIVIAEVILAVAGLQTIAPAPVILPAGVLCFTALELFGMCFYAIPYYTGFIAHLPNGAIPTLRIGQLQAGGLPLLIDRLAVNKPPFLTAPVIAALWLLFIGATFLLDTLPYFYYHRNIK